MRRRHFETLRPVCPVCRTANDPGFALRLAHVAREEDEHILEGALHCSNGNCLREYPIVDGIPVIVAGIREYVTNHVMEILGRRDQSAFVESILGDCSGPGSPFDHTRQQLSSYAWDHYGRWDPNEPSVEPGPGGTAKVLNIGRELTHPTLPGPRIDVGCSVGGGTFALAKDTDELVLGVDLNFAMLRLAAEVLQHGKVRYPRRRVGLVFDRREFLAPFADAENVDFWACDAAALPFPTGTFALAVSLNVLDCVYAPREMLASIGQVLQAGGKAVIACPYDWSANAAPLEAWLGGHSQRAQLAGSSEEILRTLLTPGAHPGSIGILKLVAEREDLPWHVRLHERSTMTYKLHLVVAERMPNQEPAKS